MEEIYRPVRQTANAPSQSPSTSEAGDLGKEVERSPALGGGSDHSEEVQDTRQAAPEQSGGWVFEEAGQPVSPVKNRALSHGAIPSLDKNRPTAKCWWCQHRTQTREHLFKCCPYWKRQQKILWAEVRKQTGRSKYRFKIRDLFADERCSPAILDFLPATDVGRRGWIGLRKMP
jgi:hypothetical protein